jgi:hypothetical protein
MIAENGERVSGDRSRADVEHAGQKFARLLYMFGIMKADPVRR